MKSLLMPAEWSARPVPSAVRRVATVAALGGAVALTVSACGQQGGPGALCAADKAPPRCSTSPDGELDLMAWAPQERANVSRLMKGGAVVVRYDAEANCSARLSTLSSCTVRRSYDYAPYHARESKKFDDRASLYAALPLGAASLEGRLNCETSVRTDFDLAGVAALPPDAIVSRADLEGPGCAGATHVLGRVYLGGFALVTGARSDVAASATVFGVGAGAGKSSALTFLQAEGSPEQCEDALKAGQARQLCSVPLRVGLLPVLDTANLAKLPISASLEKAGTLRHMGRALPNNYGLVCPEGEAVAGFWGEQASSGESRSIWIWKFGVICAPVIAVRDGSGGPVLKRGAPHRLTESVGVGGASPWERLCAEDEFATSLSVEWRSRMSDGTGPEYIGAFSARCGRARVTSDGGVYGVSVTTDNNLVEAGSSLGGTRFIESCADGKQPKDGFITELRGFAGNLLETIEATCSVPKVRSSSLGLPLPR